MLLLVLLVDIYRALSFTSPARRRLSLPRIVVVVLVAAIALLAVITSHVSPAAVCCTCMMLLLSMNRDVACLFWALLPIRAAF